MRFAVALCVGAGAFCLSERFAYNYRGYHTDALTREFAHPLLAGIWSDPAKVDAIEGTLAFLSNELRAGETLLAYDNAPLFYYLTQSPPALDHVWVTKLLPLPVRERSMEKMLENERVPRFAIRNRQSYPGLHETGYRETTSIDPVHAFVLRNYRKVKEFPPFEIWRLKNPARIWRIKERAR